MKILKVILRNLHSLKGNHTIDFANGVLANAGLYAITGQTGAGKSTILDAITLALYGQSNRHGNAKAEEEIITRNEKEAFAETAFEVNHEVYVARWAASYTRNRTLKATERRLYKQVDGDLLLLAEGVSATQTAVLGIIGLNFDQFTKSVLLAQNNFSAFLKAKPSERAEMLSKITGTQIYEEISKAVFEQTSILKEEINQLTAQLSGDLLDEDTIVFLGHQLIEKSKQLESIKLSLQAISDKISQIKESESLALEIETLASNLQQIATKQIEYIPQFELLDNYQKALLLQHDLHKYEQTQAHIEATHHELLACESVLSETIIAADALQSLIEASRQATLAVENELNTKLPAINEAKILQLDFEHKNTRLQETNAWLVNHEKQFQQYQAKLLTLKEQQSHIETAFAKEQQLVDQYHQYATWETQRSVVANHYTQITSAQKSIQACDTENLKAQLLTLHDSLFAVQADFAAQQEKLQQEEQFLSELSLKLLGFTSFENLSIGKEHLQQQQLTLDKLMVDVQEQSTLISQQAQLQESLQTLNGGLDHLTSALAKQTSLVEALQHNYLLTQKIASLEAHRAALKDGDPCPLCGAMHHPFAVQSPVIDESKAALLEAEKELSTFRNQLSDNEKKQALLNAELKNMQAQLQVLALSIDTLSQQLQVGNTMDAFLLFQDALTKKTAENQAAFHASQLLRDELVSQNMVVKKCTEALTAVTFSVGKLKNEIDLLAQSLQNQEAIVKEKQEMVQLSFNEVIRIFKEYGESLPENNIEQAKDIAIKLSNNFKQYAAALANSISIKDKRTELLTALAEINALTNNLQKELLLQTANQKQQSDEVSLLAQALANIIVHFVHPNPVAEEQRLRNELTVLQEKTNASLTKQASTTALINEKKQVLEKLTLAKENGTVALAAISQTLSQQLEINGFETIEALKFAITFPHHAQIKIQKETLEKEQQQLNGALNNAQAKFQAILAKGLPIESLADLQDSYLSNDAQQINIHQEIGSIREQLRKNELELAQNQQKVAFIKEKDVVYQQWQQLNSLIGSKSGDSFKKFAQDFTLTLLIQHANRHLKVMYNRYELYKKDDSTEMELQIKDKNFFDDVRNINSLSGGETFLVSLSLALGLSDLASKKTKIRSLFIDEGFGTLDPENLNNALDALELLRQTDDRQIGIISHVEELKKRIHTQIQVNKVSAEFSEISIVD